MRSKTLFLVLVLATGCLWAQEKKETPPPAGAATTAAPAAPHPATITAEDKARKNPVKFTEVSVDRGKKIYATQCALCHGDKGDGKGELAADMKLNLPDFTKPDTLKDRTDGELFAIIGGRERPHAVASRSPDRNPPMEPGELSARSFRQSAGEIHGERARGKHYPGSTEVD